MKRLSKTVFGTLTDGQKIHEYTLENCSGIKVSLLTLGCTMTRIMVPDRTGHFDDIILGFDTLDAYLDADNPYLGCIIGRTANRIANHCITINDKQWPLSCNHGKHHLHGGTSGFNKKVWTICNKEESTHSANITLSYKSPHLEEGYPGNLGIDTTISLSDENTLEIRYKAHTDQSTLVNLTHHPYFNLSGDVDCPCTDHWLKIKAHRFTETDMDLIPTGNICELKNLPIDFGRSQSIGDQISTQDYPMVHTHGYDHNFILDKKHDSPEDINWFAAELLEPRSGRTLVIHTTQPCLQFYSGNSIPNTLKGKENKTYYPHAGLCLEPQGYPDAGGHKNFESSCLEPGQEYDQTIQYKFGVRSTKAKEE